MAIDHSFLRKLRLMGTVEGISTLVLFFIAMPLKYGAGIPLAVSIVGPIHGVFFIALSTMCVLAMKRVPIGRKLGILGIVAAFFPFGPFLMDRKLARLAQGSAGV